MPGMKSELEKPRTLVLPPAPYGASMLGGWWLDRHHTPFAMDLGGVSWFLGWVLVVAGLGMFAWALYTLQRHHTTVNPYKAASELCMDGPFRHSRNPIYLGDWLLLLGVALVLNTWWPLVFAPVIWLLLRYGVIRHEETHLEQKFGAQYRSYRARVRRWL